MRSWPTPHVPVLPGEGIPLRVHDTSSGALRLAAEGPNASLYVCGITPYDATHLGHAATYVAFDLVQRVWRDSGLSVRYVQNVTDVDDPLLERASRDAVDWRELASSQTALFAADMTALAVIPPDSYVGATEAIPQIVAAVETLLARGAAYELEGDIYFAIDSDPQFGAVGHYDRETMLALSAERGGDPGRPGKKDALDPRLWQAARPGEPSWDSPLGAGRPGWHIECAAIALAEIGASIDVQGGGRDLIFPHHEMGAAHAHVLTGVVPFARNYLHAGMVALDGEKMSKSRGNLVFVSALRAAGVHPMAIRLGLLGHHYREDWEWTDADLTVAQDRLARWWEALSRDRGPAAEGTLRQVREAMSDDLDAPGAIAVVDSWVNRQLADGGDDLGAPGILSRAIDALLGLRF